MGKRKHERSNSSLRRKIRRLQRKLRHSTSCSDDEEYDQDLSRPQSPELSEAHVLSSYSDLSEDDKVMRSYVSNPNISIPPSDPEITNKEVLSSGQEPSTSEMQNGNPAENLPPEILEALGDPVSKEEILGPAINEEIAKRWGRILVEGLTKEFKDAVIKKTLVPENLCLAKAPKLNLELVSVVGDNIKNRDKFLEKAQNQLGIGVAGLASLASSLITDDLSKVDILKKLSEVSQIFLDLHYENTKHRRKIIASSLEKNFSNTITEVKRDSYLFGSNLGEKIKASKSAERSGLQVKRTNNASIPSTSRQQVNWKGPPRFSSNRTRKPGGQKTRYPSHQGYQTHQGRRTLPPGRPSNLPKMDQRNRRTQ